VRVDLVVVGGGALGLSTAVHAALRGGSVAVVERRTLGSQASGRAAGLFKSIQADRLRTYLATRSIQKVCTFAEWSGVELAVNRTGSLMVARTDAHRKLVAHERDQSRGWGVAVDDLTAAELGERSGIYLPTGDELALWCPADVYVEEPTALIDAYRAAAELQGVELLESEQAVEVVLAGNRVIGVETSSRRIDTAAVVDAGGAWVRQVAELAGSWVAAAPVRHQLVITEPTADVRGADPIVRVADAAVYVRPARGGLMLGGFEADPMAVDPRQQPASFGMDDLALDVSVVDTMVDAVGAEVPAAKGPVAEHRGGLFTMTPDGRFLLGPVPEVDGLWVISGCNGSGFSSSPALGEVLADWITDGTSPVDVSALDPARFPRMSDELLVERGAWQYAHYYDPAPAGAGGS
jgi:glycine/D-amino acid oxidase-like deaminating enzyme